MRTSRITVWAVLVIGFFLLGSCDNASPSSIQIDENSVEAVSFEETIRINNCGNLTESEQTRTRAFSTSVEGEAELQVGVQVIEGSISGKYGQYRSEATSQKLIAAANTNMEFVLRWSEEMRAGNVVVDGRTGSYSVRIPVAVEQVSSRDLGCNGGSEPTTNPTSPASQSQPASTPESVSPSNRICRMIVIEGNVGGLPIAQTKTWSELGVTTQDLQSSNLDELCSRTSDNEVKVWIGYWSGDSAYLDFRGEMTPDAAILLVEQNPNQPVVIVPWGE